MGPQDLNNILHYYYPLEHYSHLCIYNNMALFNTTQSAFNPVQNKPGKLLSTFAKVLAMLGQEWDRIW